MRFVYVHICFVFFPLKIGCYGLWSGALYSPKNMAVEEKLEAESSERQFQKKIVLKF